MTWKVDGKIAMNFPGSGVPNRDTYRIRFAPTGCSAESKILEIEKVYFVPAGVTVTQENLSQYLVWHRYWESDSYVPYDNTCSIIIHGDDPTQKFTVQVMKDGEDVTSSLDHLKVWAYIVNDVLPSYRLFVHNIPYGTIIADGTEFSITELINACKVVEGIADSRYDNTKGEYRIDASEITSKAGGSFPVSGAIACQNNIVVPYALTEDTSTNDLWIVVSQNTSNTPIEIKTIKVATTYTGQGATSIYVFHESGLLVYRYDSTWYTPSVTTQEHGGVTYNYVTIDLTALSTGTFSLKRGEKYYIKIKHASNNDNHYYYRDGGIIGIVGFVTGDINLPNATYDVSSLTYDQEKSTEAAMLTVSTVNHYARYTGSSNCFSSNQVYKCKQSFTYTGTTDDDCELLAMTDGAIGTYNGQAGAMSLGNKSYVKSGPSVTVTKTNDYSVIVSCNDPTQIFKFTGNSAGSIIEQNKFYSCNSPTTITATINSEPDVATVNMDDIYLLTTSIYNPQHSSGWNGAGFYKVTAVNNYSYTTVQDVSYVTGNGKYRFLDGKWTQETDYVRQGYYEVTNYVSLASMTLTQLAEPSFTVTKQNSPVTDETNNMKAKLSELTNNNISTYYDLLSSADLSGLTVSTTHKHEILMES